MLPDISLDDENYEEILEEARNIIISRYPEWTDFNAHDPGITLLELFSMLKESQQFFANQIGEENRKKYLKLLGFRRKTKQPAHSLIQIQAGDHYGLLRSHKLAAGNLCFENRWPKQLIPGDISYCMAVRDGNAEDGVSRGQLEFGSMPHCWVFGEHPEPGNEFYVCLDEPLPLEQQLDLYIQIYQGYSVGRNPLRGNDFVPMVQLTWQYYTAQGWKAVSHIQDGTYGFLFDGFIRFMVDTPMKQYTVCGREGYFLCAVLQEGEYDVAPVLTRISMNVCEVVQIDTLVECMVQKKPQNSLVSMDTELAVLGKSEIYVEQDSVFYPVASFNKWICEEEGNVKYVIEDERLAEAERIMVINRDLSFLHNRSIGIGTGFPYQEIDLEDLQIRYESFALLVQDRDSGNGFRLWDRVEDFAASSAEDRHYILDSQRGILRFGDCIHGMAPEGEILLASYVRTRGQDGNVRRGAINRFRMDGLEEVALFNIKDGVGGCDEETLEESFLRVQRSMKEGGGAVTKQDYEKYVRQTPGLMIEECKALSVHDVGQFMKQVDETGVYLVVKPYGQKLGSRTEERYARNIRGYLEHYRMLGSHIYILFPEYVELEVYVEAVVKPQYIHVEERVKMAVREFFDRNQQKFGSVISNGSLYGFLERQDFILKVCSLHMETRGDGVKRNVDGDIQLSPYGIAVLDKVRVLLL